MGESLGSYSHVRYADALPLLSYRDDWASRHFLHPKTLRKAREVRTQLLDIMKHQKLDIIPCGTDWDVIRCAPLDDVVCSAPSRSPLPALLFAGRRSVRLTSTRRRASRVSESTNTCEQE